MENTIGFSDSLKDSKFYPLVQQVKSPDFQVIPAFENSLIKNFMRALQLVVDRKFEGDTVISLKAYTTCMLIVAEKDNKFLKHALEPLEPSCYQLLTLIIRKDSLIDNEGSLYYLILSLIYEISKNQEKAEMFVQCCLHKYLILNTLSKSPWLKDVRYAFKCLDIMGIIISTDYALKEISAIDSLGWLLDFMEFLGNNHDDHESVVDAILKAINLLHVIVCTEPLIKNDHIKQCEKVFTRLLKIMPSEHHEVIITVKHQMTGAIVQKGTGSSCTSKNPLPIRNQTRNSSGKAFTLRMSQLNLNPIRTSNRPTLKMRMKNQSNLSQNMIIEKMDPCTNVYLKARSLKDIFMDSTSELICGMMNANRGGNIHIGFHSSGKVEGVRVTHQDRDGLRSGIDSLFVDELSPVLLPSFVNVKFFPIRNREGVVDEDLCIIQIIIPANMNTVYHLKNRNSCFVYREGVNIRLSLPEVRKLTVNMTEIRFKY